MGRELIKLQNDAGAAIGVWMLLHVVWANMSVMDGNQCLHLRVCSLYLVLMPFGPQPMSPNILRDRYQYLPASAA
jgi:hypothetical protein